MLHIILLILKILGLAVLAILALILLLTAAVIFSPLVYRADASADGRADSLKAEIRFHWLLRLVSGKIHYEEGKFSWHLRALWKQFDSEMTEADSKKAEHNPVREDTSVPKAPVSQVKEDKGPEKETAVPETGKNRTFRHTKKKKKKFYEKFIRFWEKIKYTFYKICDTIRSLREKKEKLAAFVDSEIHRNAFSRAIKELKRLLCSLCPDRASVQVEFGFSDPSVTGYVLAAVSMIYPVIGEYSEICPDFEKKVLKGSARIEGKVRALCGAVLVWNLLFDKNIRTTYRDIKNFRL